MSANNNENSIVYKVLNDLGSLNTYVDELSVQLSSLVNASWSDSSIRSYVEYLKANASSLDDIKTIFKNTMVIGSDIYAHMLEFSDLDAKAKLYLIREHDAILGYCMKATVTNNLDDKDFYDIVNSMVLDSKILEENKPGDMMFNWIHFDLRTELNEAGAFDPYVGLSDDETLCRMIEGGWMFAGSSVKDTIMASRYHAMLPDGYDSYNHFEEVRGYDVRYNVKLLSVKRNFERIYNTKIKKFVDVDPYMYNRKSTNLDALYKITAVNMPTYNFGYSRKRGHTRVDVNPFKIANGSMDDVLTQMNVLGYQNREKYYWKLMFSFIMSFIKRSDELRGNYTKVKKMNREFANKNGMKFKGQL